MGLSEIPLTLVFASRMLALRPWGKHGHLSMAIFLLASSLQAFPRTTAAVLILLAISPCAYGGQGQIIIEVKPSVNRSGLFDVVTASGSLNPIRLRTPDGTVVRNHSPIRELPLTDLVERFAGTWTAESWGNTPTPELKLLPFDISAEQLTAFPPVPRFLMPANGSRVPLSFDVEWTHGAFGTQGTGVDTRSTSVGANKRRMDVTLQKGKQDGLVSVYAVEQNQLFIENIDTATNGDAHATSLLLNRVSIGRLTMTAAVPEPAKLTLLSVGCAGMAALRRRK